MSTVVKDLKRTIAKDGLFYFSIGAYLGTGFTVGLLQGYALAREFALLTVAVSLFAIVMRLLKGPIAQKEKK